MNPNQRYWLSMLGIGLATFLAEGIVAGTVSLHVGARNPVSGVVAALILVAGWLTARRVRERKKLDLPLWRGLDAGQARELAQYREFARTGKIVEPSGDEVRRAGVSPAGPLSARDRARIADVKRQKAKRQE